MPDRTINQALDAFEAGVTHLDSLAAELETVTEVNRKLIAANEQTEKFKFRMKFVLVALIVVILGLTGLGVTGWVLYGNSIESACRSRNSGTRVTNTVLTQIFDFFDSASDENDEFISQMRLILARNAEQNVVDCDKDGSIDNGDYPETRVVE